MEVTVYVGEHGTVVTADDSPYSPDVMDDLTARAVSAAIELQRELLAEDRQVRTGRTRHGPG